MELEHIINLSYEVQKAKDGFYDNEAEIISVFDKFKADIETYKTATLKALNSSANCTHSRYSQPYYQIKRNLIGDHVTWWYKTCEECGRVFTEITESNKPPSGYEGAVQKYYNNNF